MPSLLTGLIQFVFTAVMSLLGVLLLLRAWVHVWAFSPRHPIVQLARRATDWLVDPLPKIIRMIGRALRRRFWPPSSWCSCSVC